MRDEQEKREMKILRALNRLLIRKRRELEAGRVSPALDLQFSILRSALRVIRRGA
jgi:hypothetical protein